MALTKYFWKLWPVRNGQSVKTRVKWLLLLSY